jgi:DNA-directed RNA polymerase specialized sigma24 family protein
MENSEFERLLAALRRGDQQAAEELLRRYEPYVRRIIHLRLTDEDLRRVFETMDIYQSVVARFLAAALAGRFAELRTPEELRKLLASMAINNLISKVRRERKHRESRSRVRQPPAPDPNPSQVAAEEELVRTISSRLSQEELWLFQQNRVLRRSWQEIAVEVREEADTLRFRLTRALARVKRELRAEELSHGS